MRAFSVKTAGVVYLHLVQLSAVTHTEHHQIPEAIDFFDVQIVKKSGVARLKRRREPVPSVVVGWLLLLNFLVFILMSEIARSIVIR